MRFVTPTLHAWVRVRGRVSTGCDIVGVRDGTSEYLLILSMLFLLLDVSALIWYAGVLQYTATTPQAGLKTLPLVDLELESTTRRPVYGI